jgi:molybdenum cofactor cytidylyltransferase
VTHPNMPSAIILAAGYSRRMDEFKPLLKLGRETVIGRVVSLYLRLGVTDIRVVTGYHSQEIRSTLVGQPVCMVHNPEHDRGMFTSVLTGVNSLPSTTRSFFIHPVDIPLVRPHTMRLLLDAAYNRPPPVIYPTFDDRRGHPPLIDIQLKQAIREHDGRGGLRALLDHFDSQALNVPVADSGIMLDMDTPDDFERLSVRSARSDLLTDDECRVLMERVCRLPARVIDHCRRVSCVAETLAGAVNAGGGNIDTPLVRCAGRIHDLARQEKHHAAAGARLLEKMGFPALAAIVAVHMDIDVHENTSPDDAQVVHLADKLVVGDTVVSLSRRFDAKREKYGHDPEVEQKIECRRQAALTIQTNIEQAAGMSIDHILEGLCKAC